MAKNNNSKYSSSKSSTTSYSSPKPVAKSSIPDIKATPAATLKKASVVVPTGEALTAEIRKMAEQVWEKKGRPQGRDTENWVEAEKIVKAKYGIK
jgi:hypothetical protein